MLSRGWCPHDMVVMPDGGHRGRFLLCLAGFVLCTAVLLLLRKSGLCPPLRGLCYMHGMHLLLGGLVTSVAFVLQHCPYVQRTNSSATVTTLEHQHHRALQGTAQRMCPASTSRALDPLEEEYMLTFPRRLRSKHVRATTPAGLSAAAP